MFDKSVLPTTLTTLITSPGSKTIFRVPNPIRSISLYLLRMHTALLPISIQPIYVTSFTLVFSAYISDQQIFFHKIFSATLGEEDIFSKNEYFLANYNAPQTGIFFVPKLFVPK